MILNVLGLKSANSNYPCIYCLANKNKDGNRLHLRGENRVLLNELNPELGFINKPIINQLDTFDFVIDPLNCFFKNY